MISQFPIWGLRMPRFKASPKIQTTLIAGDICPLFHLNKVSLASLSGPAPRRRLCEHSNNRIFCDGRDDGSKPNLRRLAPRLWSFKRLIRGSLRSLTFVAVVSLPSLPWAKLPSLLLWYSSTPPSLPSSGASLFSLGGLAVRACGDPGWGSQDRGERLFRSCKEKGELTLKQPL